MKRIFVRFICPILLFAGNFMLLGALEMELTGGIDFMTFHPDRKTPHSEPGNPDNVFSYYPMGLFNFSLRGDINDTLAYSINLERDKVLQNSINAVFLARTDYFKTEFGPFIGLCDTLDIPDVGIAGSMEAALPGLVSLTLSGFSTLGTQLDFTSNNFREGFEVKLRLWLPKILLTVSAGTKNLSISSDEGTLIRCDALTRLMLSVDIYSKGSPIMLGLDGGHQTYSRTYKQGLGYEITDELKSFFGGARIQLNVSESFIIKAGIEIPFLVTAERPMTVTGEFLNLLKCNVGFVYTFHGRYE